MADPIPDDALRAHANEDDRAPVVCAGDGWTMTHATLCQALLAVRRVLRDIGCREGAGPIDATWDNPADARLARTVLPEFQQPTPGLGGL